MRSLLIISCLLTFSLNSFAISAGTLLPSELSGNVVEHVKHDSNAHHDHDHGDTEHKKCDECCCIHAHSVALLVSSDFILSFSIQKGKLRFNSESHYPFDPASPYRPPRA